MALQWGNMKLIQAIQESMTIELMGNPSLWKSLIGLWSQLDEKGKVRGEDEGLFLSYQYFYKSFLRKNKRKPLYKDALKFVATN